MSVYLGLDYGRAHLGVALSEHLLATPLATLLNSSHSKLVKHLSQYVTDHQVDKIVCGLPEGKLAKEVQTFAGEITKILGLPVILHPETLSTQEAITKLRAAGANRQKLHNDHAYAACLILEDYLEGVYS